MRVIAGSAKHLPLKSVPGMKTRPTTDKIKETLFNILQQRVYGCRFLDLFGGTGGIGIEALSRGAELAVFVDSAKAAQKCIKENLAFTGLSEKAMLFSQDVIPSLRSIEKLGAFDIVFMDPPYGKELEKAVLIYLADSPVITEDSLLIVEADLHTDFSYAEGLGYEISRIKKYKTNMHVFLKKKA